MNQTSRFKVVYLGTYILVSLSIGIALSFSDNKIDNNNKILKDYSEVISQDRLRDSEPDMFILAQN